MKINRSCLLTLFVISLAGFAGAPRVLFAAETGQDRFSLLENIKIGDQLSRSILSAGIKDPESAGEVYTFESERYSHPHIVYLTENKVSFIQLTIPKDSQEKYQKDLRFLGPPEERLPKTRSEIMNGYPSKGLAFIINGYSGNVERVQKFAPKSVEEFRNREGKNFTPFDINKLLPISKFASTTKFHRLLERIPSWGLLTVFLFSTAGSVGLLLWLFRILRAKNSYN